MRDELQKRLDRIVELVKTRDKATQELLEILGISESDVSRETKSTQFYEDKGPEPQKLRDLKPLVDDSTTEVTITGPVECKKCALVAAGGDGRGRHNKGCPKTNGPVITKKERPPVTGEKPDEGYEADWRSKCCNARLIVRGGDEGTNHYECFKCCNPCDPVTPEPEPEPERIKRFECEDCGKKFEADTSEDIKCDCGSSNVWPASV